MKSIGLAVCLLCAWISLGVASEKTLVLATAPFPPFRIIQADGSVAGADADIVREVFALAGYRVRYQVYPLARATDLLIWGGVAGFVSVTSSPERERYCHFSLPINHVRDVFFKRKDRTIAWRTMEDLAPYVVGHSGYNYAPVFLDAIRRQVFRRVETVRAENPEPLQFRKLLAGRMDLFICELNVGLWFLRNHAPEFSGIDSIATPVGPVRSFHVAFSKRWAGVDELVRQFNQALVQWKQTQRQGLIFSKYGMVGL